MPRTPANGIEIEYDTFGSKDDPTLLLIMGLGAQLIAWEEGFCRQIADRGFHVVRFDNRDVGLSTKLEDAPPVDLAGALAGDASSAPYLISDMAADAAALLDAIGVEKAHIVGASMGGMIAQQFAIDYPQRTLSLCSIMSTTGDREVGQPTPEAMEKLLRPPAQNKEEYIESSVDSWKVIGSPGELFDEDRVRRRAAQTWDRSYYPMGVARQLVAVLASPDRTDALCKLDIPTVVIHGEVDPLVTLSGGQATAKACPNAELVVVPGMGHDLPEPLWPTIVDAIVGNAEKAQANA